MRSDRVVYHQPCFDHISGILHIRKPMLIQAVIPQSGIEALEGRILRRFPGGMNCRLALFLFRGQTNSVIIPLGRNSYDVHVELCPFRW